MKKLFALFIAAAISIGAGAATLLPVQLLNPTGSTSGQAIISTGASSAPAWGGISVASLTGLGTGVSTALTTAVTGSGGIVLGTSPTITTPTITGVISGACAATGNVGECKNSNVPPGSPVALTTSTAANITSVSLTAGNWLCYGNVGFLPGGTTVITNEQGWISASSAAVPTAPNAGAYTVLALASATGAVGTDILPVGMTMENVTTTTTVFLEAFSIFNTSNQAAYGYINCIRWH